MPLNIPPIVTGAPTSSGGAGMDNLSRILELKARQDTLQITREQLQQRQRELQFEETGRTLNAARAVIENTQPGSPAWKNATQHIVRAYGGNPDAITVPDADVAKAISAAIKKINAASQQYSTGKTTRSQFQDQATEIAVATLMGLGAYSVPLGKGTALGQSAELLTAAAQANQGVQAAAIEQGIRNAGHAAQTADTLAAQTKIEDIRLQNEIIAEGTKADIGAEQHRQETDTTTKAMKERFDYGIGRPAGSSSGTRKPFSLPVGDIYKQSYFDSIKAQTTVTETAPPDARTGAPGKTTTKVVPATEQMQDIAARTAKRAVIAALRLEGRVRGDAETLGDDAAGKGGVYAQTFQNPRLAALAATADTLTEDSQDPVKGWIDTFKFYGTDSLFENGYAGAVDQVWERLLDIDALRSGQVRGWENIGGDQEKTAAFLDNLLKASGVTDDVLRARLIADIKFRSRATQVR